MVFAIKGGWLTIILKPTIEKLHFRFIFFKRPIKRRRSISSSSFHQEFRMKIPSTAITRNLSFWRNQEILSFESKVKTLITI